MDINKMPKTYAERTIVHAKANEDYYRHPAKYYLKPFKLAGNLYYIGDKMVCSHLIDTGDGLIVFDSGFPHATHLLVQAIWELGFNPAAIKYLIHSHGHFDHIGGANAFKELYGCQLCLSAADAAMFRTRPDLALLKDGPSPFAELFVPDIELEDGAVLTLGNTSIRCVLTPGHTPGVMSFFFTIQEQDKTYNVGYFGGAGFNTLYKTFFDQYHLSYALRDAFLASLAKVRNYKVDIVMGNHPNMNHTLEKREQQLANPQGPNPFIDATEWQRMCDNLQHDFKAFLASGR